MPILNPEVEQQSLSNMFLLEKMVRIVKDSPGEQMLLLKACNEDPRFQYKGDSKRFSIGWIYEKRVYSGRTSRGKNR